MAMLQRLDPLSRALYKAAYADAFGDHSPNYMPGGLIAGSPERGLCTPDDFPEFQI
ncbi:MAG: hypothetical protein H7173_14140 [Rhodoferax sp.]|nr:hypothetical protein [Pseudorhodobacter sp.]